jgi:hypothetical protein
MYPWLQLGPISLSTYSLCFLVAFDESSLNGLGQQGWELAAAVPGSPNVGQTYLLLFKRRQQSEAVQSPPPVE